MNPMSGVETKMTTWMGFPQPFRCGVSSDLTRYFTLLATTNKREAVKQVKLNAYYCTQLLYAAARLARVISGQKQAA